MSKFQYHQDKSGEEDSIMMCVNKGDKIVVDTTVSWIPEGDSPNTMMFPNIECMEPEDTEPPEAKKAKVEIPRADDPAPDVKDDVDVLSLEYAMANTSVEALGLKNPEMKVIFEDRAEFCKHFGIKYGKAGPGAAKAKCAPDKDCLDDVLDNWFLEEPRRFNFKMFFVMLLLVGYDMSPHVKQNENKFIVALRNAVEKRNVFDKSNKRVFKVLASMVTMEEFVEDVYNEEMWNDFKRRRLNRKPLAFALSAPLHEDSIASVYDSDKNILGDIVLMSKQNFLMSFNGHMLDDFVQLRKLRAC